MDDGFEGLGTGFAAVEDRNGVIADEEYEGDGEDQEGNDDDFGEIGGDPSGKIEVFMGFFGLGF